MKSVDVEDPAALARACAARMQQHDRASAHLGIKLEDVGPGWARLSMQVTDGMVNGYEMTHGGFIFTLADSAFAFACNSHNYFAVGQFCSITFLLPSAVGDRLVAFAEERRLSGRSGLYDVSVKNQRGEVVAEFRGHCRMVPGQHFPDADSGSEETQSSAGAAFKIAQPASATSG